MSIQIIEKAISDIRNEHISMKGPYGAFGICNLVAYRMGYGLFKKRNPTINDCIVNSQGYAADIIINFDTHRAYNILYNCGKENTPVWNPIEKYPPELIGLPLRNYPIIVSMDNLDNNNTNNIDSPVIDLLLSSQESNNPSVNLSISELQINKMIRDYDSILEILNRIVVDINEIRRRQNRAFIGPFGIRLIPDQDPPNYYC